MPFDRYFNEAASAQLVLDPYADKVIGANQESAHLLGLTPAEIRRCPASRLFAPNLPALIVFSQQLIEQGRAWCDTLILQAAQGDIRVEVNGRLEQNGAGARLHFSLQNAEQLENLRTHSNAERHYLSGVGHWNRVASVFQEFERENQLLLDAVGEGIYGLDTAGITTFVNPAAERILGYTSAELAGRKMHSTVHHSHADGAHFKPEHCPIMAAFRDGAVHTSEDDVFWHKSGRPIDVEFTSTPIRDNGYIVGAVVIFRDVSQKKKDKKRLLAALDEVESLKNRLELENAYLQEEINSSFNHHQIIGNSPAVKNILRQIRLVAPTAATVLISGESGSGKELIARAIHEMSERRERSLIKVNCAAIPAELFESEFFGHCKGAFSGASQDHTGRFELADGGTLLLDEVGEIPPRLQGKLLRVLQEQQFERVGEAGRTRHVDVRIIAATNRDLKQSVASGEFRQDLYFRLNVFPLEAAPLRQRPADIPLLTQHFLEKARARGNRPPLRIPRAEMDRLAAYHWPGNIRELENVIERQVILTQGDTLRFNDLQTRRSREAPAAAHGPVLTEAELKAQQRRNLIQALETCRGKISGQNGVAELLGVAPTTVASRLRKYRLDARRFKPSATETG